MTDLQRQQEIHCIFTAFWSVWPHQRTPAAEAIHWELAQHFWGVSQEPREDASHIGLECALRDLEAERSRQIALPHMGEVVERYAANKPDSGKVLYLNKKEV